MSNLEQIALGQFILEHNNKDSAEQTINEIFNELPYQFTSLKDNPFIIDAGSNIGIATLFFKSIYPKAEIICFEPDPSAFRMLKINRDKNELQDVTLINAALSCEEKEIDFFGQIFMDTPDARGNSIIDAWGLQRSINNTTQVKSVKLSSYINKEIDFLKLDIEGAEQQVLEELDKENKISLIREMTIEVHQSEKIKEINNIEVILKLLNKNKFDIEMVEKNIGDSLPYQIQEWVKKINPRLFVIRAKKIL